MDRYESFSFRNVTDTSLVVHISLQTRAAPRRFALWVLHARASFRMGLARPLSRGPPGEIGGAANHDRHLCARYDGLEKIEARHGITIAEHPPLDREGWRTP